RECGVLEPARRERRRWMVMDQDVGPRHELPEAVPIGSRARVENDATLVGVEIEEEAALLRMRDSTRKRASSPGAVPTRLLDLAHIRSDVGQHLRGVSR